MARVKNTMQIYKKIYGRETPTKEKIENAKLINGLLEDIFAIAKADSESKAWRLPELLEMVKTQYDTPGNFQTWLLDSVKEIYQSGYGERRG